MIVFLLVCVVGLQYSFSRLSDLPSGDQDPRIVCFVDLGHTNLTATVSSFTQNGFKVFFSMPIVLFYAWL